MAVTRFATGILLLLPLTIRSAVRPALAQSARRSVCAAAAAAMPEATAAAAAAPAALAEPSRNAFYSLTPLRSEEGRAGFGARVDGVDLSTVALTPDFARQLKDDLRDYRVLLFRKQGRVPGQRQVDISAALGELESTFYKHPMSPHPDVFRVSNDESQGCTNVGRTGWHVDGTFQYSPFKYQTMHFHSVCEGGETHFVPLKEVFETASPALQSLWERLWMVTGRGHSHPLVYRHPVRGDQTMIFHCGASFAKGWALESEASKGFAAGKAPEIDEILSHAEVKSQLTEACQRTLPAYGLKMRWEEGDFAINDNTGNAHYAVPGTQADPRTAGLRILHRTTVAGDTVPTKMDGRESFSM